MVARALALWLIALAVPSLASAQDPSVEGVVVAIHGVDANAAIEAARSAGGARWSLERLEPRAIPRAEPPGELVSRLREAYLAADFLRCSTAAQEPALELDTLLTASHRAAAAEVAVFGAACAFGAGDVDLARRLIERAFAAELDVAASLAVTTPDFQAAAEQVRSELVRRARLETRVATRPAGAAALVDGGAARCRPSPCSLTLLPGAHSITVSRLGYAPRTISVAAGEPHELALDPAPSAVVRAQLGAALARGLDPGDVELARTAASAFEARVVVVVWTRADRAHALVFDRARGRVLARIAARGEGAVPTTVRSVIAEWRGITEPAEIYEEPLFWILTGAAAIAAGVLVYFIARPPDRTYDLVFFSR